MKEDLFLGMGGNLGDVKENFRLAIQALRDSEHFEIHGISSAYRTSALTVNGIDSEKPSYWNIVVRASSDLTPEALLRFCKMLETESGRNQDAPRWSSRTLDIDILAWGELNVDSTELKLPHPHCLERSFVLAPWSELAPGFQFKLNDTLARIGDAWSVLEADQSCQPKILGIDAQWM